MGANRIGRINDEVRKELGDLIPMLKDPRVSGGLISVISVDVSKDLTHAKVFVSVLGSEEAQEQALRGLSSGAGFLRREIGRRLQLRSTPELHFALDHSIEHGAHINKILHDIGEGTK